MPATQTQTTLRVLPFRPQPKQDRHLDESANRLALKLAQLRFLNVHTFEVIEGMVDRLIVVEGGR